MFQFNFALYAKQILEVDEMTTGLLLCYVGVLAGLTNGFAMGRLSRAFSEDTLRWWSSRVMAAALLAWGTLVYDISTLCVVLAPLGLCGTC